MFSQVAYSFDLFYQIHVRYPYPSLFKVKDGAYYRAIWHDAGLTLLKVHSNGSDLTITPLIGILQLDTIKHILGCDTDLHEFYDFARQDEKLWSIVQPLYGLPLYRSENLFEALVFVIIEQHISWVNAQKAQRVLVEWGNNFIEYAGMKHYAMPTPQQLAAATIDDLKATKITFKRMQLLIDIAQKFVDEPGFLHTESQLSAQALYDSLLKIKGIGHWTASVVVARALGQYAFVPHNDVALQAAVAEYFGVEKSPAATRTVFAAYGDFAGLAAHFTLMKWVLEKYPVVNG